jgi:hypothetical protein
MQNTGGNLLFHEHISQRVSESMVFIHDNESRTRAISARILCDALRRVRESMYINNGYDKHSKTYKLWFAFQLKALANFVALFTRILFRHDIGYTVLYGRLLILSISGSICSISTLFVYEYESRNK